MRLLAGLPANLAADRQDRDEGRQWSFVHAGQWLGEVLAKMRSPDGLRHVAARVRLEATLRKYQEAGVDWLCFLSGLGLGACLADDMGLGKTIQVLGLLLALKEQGRGKPSLLVLPASLLANWKAEMARFAPSLKAVFVHPSDGPRTIIAGRRRRPAGWPASTWWLTSYGMLLRQQWLLGRALAAGRAGRSPGNQESGLAADEARQAAAGQGADRPDRHAGGEPVVGPLVAVRLSLPGPAGHTGQVQAVRQAAQRADGEPLRAAAEPGAAVSPAAAEDRPPRDRRPAGEGRGAGLCRAEQAAGRPLRQAGRGAGRGAGQQRRHPATRPGAGLPDAAEAALQPPQPAPGRRPLPARRQRQVRPPGRDLRGDRLPPGDAAGLHAVPRDDRAAGRLLGHGLRPSRAGAAR